MMETKQWALNDLIQQVEDHLLQLHYSEDTMRHYRTTWGNLRKFADMRGLCAFSTALGRDFVKEHYGFLPEECDSKSSYRRAVVRAVEVLTEFQIHGIVFRRRCTKDDTYHVQFSGVFSEYESACKARGLAKGTLRQFSIHCRNFAKYLDHRKLRNFSEITPADIQGFVLTLTTYARHTVAYAMSVLKNLLTFAYKGGYHPQDLSFACPVVRYDSKLTIPSAFSKDEVETLLSTVDRGSPLGKRDYAIVLLASRLGLRAGEIRALRFEHLKWETNRIEFVQPKTQKLLSLHLLPEVGWAIIDYIRYGRPSQSESKFVFIRHNAPFDAFGENDNLHAVMVKYIRNAKIVIPPGKRYGLHSLRHSLVSALLESNTPMPVISGVINHARTETTNLYMKIDLGHLVECALEVDLHE